MSAVEQSPELGELLSSEQQSEVVRSLNRLAAARVADTARVERELKDGLTAVEEEIQRARRDLPASRDEHMEMEKRSFQDQRKVIFERFEREYGTLQAEFERVVAEANSKAEHILRTEKRKLTENRWEAEALYEAVKNDPARKLEEFKKLADAWTERLAAERDTVVRLLTKWKLLDLTEDRPPPAMSFDDSLGASERLQQYLSLVTTGREELQRLKMPSLVVGGFPIFAIVLLILAAVAPAWLLTQSLIAVAAFGATAGIAGAFGWFALRKTARTDVATHYHPIAQALADARAFLPRCVADQKALAEQRQRDNIATRDRNVEKVETDYLTATDAARVERDTLRDQYDHDYPPRMEAFVGERDRAMQQLDEQHRGRLQAVQREHSAALSDAEATHQRAVAEVRAAYTEQRQAVENAWNTGFAKLQATVKEIHDEAARLFPAWSVLADDAWQAPSTPPPGMKLGEVVVGLRQPKKKADDEESAGIPPRPGEPTFSLPALVPCPQKLSLLLEARGDGRAAAVRTLQGYMLRLLTSLPPAKCRFTIIDPQGLGENFAAFMHLADYDEQLIAKRIWTDPRHIEQQLVDLSEHMENVIQKYLRNEFKSIDEYNQQAEEVAEPFRFLVVANFPTGFSEAAARRLMSIASSGPRCGVFVLLSVDGAPAAPAGISMADLRQHATTLVWRKDRFVGREGLMAEFPLVLDRPPSDDVVTRILHNAGRRAKAAGRVEVPFEAICPPAEEYWKSSSRKGLDVPLGRAGAKRLQALRLGHGTSQHVLVSGKTGSGKSTLLHALVTSIALRYSPDEVELYLIDFKQGVEFKTYAVHALPHARVVAIESDREFGLSVLERLDSEMKRRAELFRGVEVQDLAGFRDTQPETPMPRILLIVDEFQEFFVEDDRTSHESALLLDRLVRQGRAFGIHILLGSQTLAGAYSLARSTLGQMAVRIALQCSEADAHLILSEDNTAARLLSRAGEAIYNDSNGLIEGNHPFQVVWLPDERRDHFLDQVTSLSNHNGAMVVRPQLVFEGNVPADLTRNPLLADWLAGRRKSAVPQTESMAWLGEAVSIKDPTAALFRQQSGSNLLIVGQNEDAALGMFVSTMVSLAVQAAPPSKTASVSASLPMFVLLNGVPAQSTASTTLNELGDLLPRGFKRAAGRELVTVVNDVAAEVTRRQEAAESNAPPIYIFAYAAHTLRDLRKDDDDFGYSRPGEEKPPSPAKQFVFILREGPAVGVHVITWCDTLTNLNRLWDRQTLRDFDQRVILQMSAADSSMLIDTPAATKLGPNRALFIDESQSHSEKFRFYRVPDFDWLRTSLVKEPAPATPKPTEPTPQTP
jgi:S-DNA-T family DNA segregation ATPase FtsK/SpoIIIE